MISSGNIIEAANVSDRSYWGPLRGGVSCITIRSGDCHRPNKSTPSKIKQRTGMAETRCFQLQLGRYLASPFLITHITHFSSSGDAKFGNGPCLLFCLPPNHVAQPEAQLDRLNFPPFVVGVVDFHRLSDTPALLWLEDDTGLWLKLEDICLSERRIC